MIQAQKGITRLISWNVNGFSDNFRACHFDQLFSEHPADVYCFQETKISEEKIFKKPGEAGKSFKYETAKKLLQVEGYESFWSCCSKVKGYCGVATYARKGLVIKSEELIGFEEDGRAIITDFGSFILINVYVPNGGRGEEYVDYKLKFCDQLWFKARDWVSKGKQVIICGDINTCASELDLWNAEDIRKKGYSGFQEREVNHLQSILNPITKDIFEARKKNENNHENDHENDHEKVLVDSFRFFYPTKKHAYSYWNQRKECRPTNHGWRIDYFLVSTSFMTSQVIDSTIMRKVMGSDHCPVNLIIKEQPIPPAHSLLSTSSESNLPKSPTHGMMSLKAMFAGKPNNKQSVNNNSSKEKEKDTEMNEKLDETKLTKSTKLTKLTKLEKKPPLIKKGTLLAFFGNNNKNNNHIKKKRSNPSNDSSSEPNHKKQKIKFD